MEIPRHLVAHYGEWWPGQGLVIVADIETRMAAAIGRWGLTRIETLLGGHVCWTIAAVDDLGRQVVCKVGPRPHAAEVFSEVPTLRAARGCGVVAVYGEADDGATLLIPRMVPGERLARSALSLPEQFAVMGQAAARLHGSTDTQPAGVPALVDRPRIAKWREALSGTPDADVLERLLARPHGEPVLLHLDLHGLNVLAHGEEWYVIDPHGAWGPREAEVQGLLERAYHHLAPPEDVVSWATVYAERMGAYLPDLLEWTRLLARIKARTVLLRGGDAPDDVRWARYLHGLADGLSSPSATPPPR